MGNSSRSPIKKNELGYQKEYQGKQASLAIDKMLRFIQPHQEQFQMVANTCQWELELHVLVRTDFSIFKMVKLNPEQMQLLGRLQINFIFNSVHRSAK